MQISKILVGIDASMEAQAAQRHALQVARRTRAELILAHACPRPELSGRSHDSVAVFGDLMIPEIAAITFDREQAGREAPGDIKISKLFIDTPPDPGLARAASHNHADMIVVGSHDRGGIARVLLGSVAERTVRLSDTTVLVARGPVPVRGYRRILVPTDFSDSAEQALEIALDLADASASVDIIHCHTSAVRTVPIPVPIGAPAVAVATPSGGDPGMPGDDLDEAILAEGERLLAAHRHDSIKLDFELIHDSPEHAIIERLESDYYDLCAMGSHGRRGLRRLLLGSVAESTVRHARCSVLVSHALAREDREDR